MKSQAKSRRESLFRAKVLISAVVFAIGQSPSGSHGGPVLDESKAGTQHAKFAAVNQETVSQRSVACRWDGRVRGPVVGLPRNGGTA